MSRVKVIFDSNDLVRSYEGGLSLAKLMSKFHIATPTIIHVLKENGVVLRTYPTWRDLPQQEVVDVYESGISENKVAKMFGVTRQAIRLLLISNHLHIRGQSEAEFLKWSQMTEEVKKHQIEAAHVSAKGKIHTFQERVNHAMSCFRTGNHATAIEKELISWLADRDIKSIGQFPIGIYNVDIAINEPPIVVEIFGGGWHSSGHHAARHNERTKYLLDQGWNVVIVWIDTRNYPLRPVVCDYLITLMNELCCGITPTRQYRVIFGDGKPAPRTRTKLNDDTTIEALGCCR
jgi:very-short-patch-repair endonuclease